MKKVTDLSTGPGDEPGDIQGYEIEQLFNQGKTFGEVWWHVQKPQIERAFAKLPRETADSILTDFARMFEPWPKWVLRVASEVWHVDFPTIPKQTIESALSFFASLF